MIISPVDQLKTVRLRRGFCLNVIQRSVSMQLLPIRQTPRKNTTKTHDQLLAHSLKVLSAGKTEEGRKL
jgi:hypothetical protein